MIEAILEDECIYELAYAALVKAGEQTETSNDKGVNRAESYKEICQGQSPPKEGFTRLKTKVLIYMWSHVSPLSPRAGILSQ